MTQVDERDLAVDSPDGHERPFASLLFDAAPEPDEVAVLPAFLADLNLDQVFAAIAEGRRKYRLEPFFAHPLSDADAIIRRHEVFRDLEEGPPRQVVESFAREMARMRQHLEQSDALHYDYQRASWFLDAVEIYHRAVAELTEQLSGLALRSRGLRGLRSYLEGYVTSKPFRRLGEEASGLKGELGGVTYSILINGLRVSVDRLGDEPDYSRHVTDVFARFGEGATKDYRVSIPDPAEMNHVEAQILDLVAQLYPETFRRLREFRVAHHDYLDAIVGRFDREVQFYLAYLERMGVLRSAGLEFCYPELSSQAPGVFASDTFDLALASKLVAAGSTVVCNDLSLGRGERIFVVTGPNQGGKTTFARTIGQLHYLARLGLPVPGTSARLLLCDRIFTHFEKEELVADLRSKLEDELLRVREILKEATGRSVVIMNESLASTTVEDALFLGRAVLQQLLARGVLGVYVTFIDELTAAGEGLVSMVSTVYPDDPARRTFKVVRKPADGRAYALAIADKYGLTYKRLAARLGR